MGHWTNVLVFFLKKQKHTQLFSIMCHTGVPCYYIWMGWTYGLYDSTVLSTAPSRRAHTHTHFNCVQAKWPSWSTTVWVCVCLHACVRASKCVVLFYYWCERWRKEGTKRTLNKAINKIIFYTAKGISAWQRTPPSSTQAPCLATTHFTGRKALS